MTEAERELYEEKLSKMTDNELEVEKLSIEKEKSETLKMVYWSNLLLQEQVRRLIERIDNNPPNNNAPGGRTYEEVFNNFSNLRRYQHAA